MNRENDNTDDGGQAFPRAGGLGWEGMTLRDYFAGQALAGVLANLAQMDSHVRSDQARFASDCYEMADAMIAQRKGQS